MVDSARKVIDSAVVYQPEPPRPLTREMPPAEKFPIAALGDVLGAAASGIADKVQVPEAMAGCCVLSCAALAAQALADVVLPTGQCKPLSLFLVTVAASGDRKSTADSEALWPISKREEKLREQYQLELPSYLNSLAAWEADRKLVLSSRKMDAGAKKAALDNLGPAPAAPLHPMLVCDEPTMEGMMKLLAIGQPSMGIFSAEGGMFIGGHAMSEEARLRSAAGLSTLWDGTPLKRVRAQDGASVLLGRRVSIHLMAQPDVAARFLTDPVLSDQGLLSRILATAPESLAGTRFHREPKPVSEAAIRRFRVRLLDILDHPLALAGSSNNELTRRALILSAEARQCFFEFSNHVEEQLGPGGEIECVRSLANKAPEHAARIAGILTMVADVDADKINRYAMASGVQLVEHFIFEAMRLTVAGKIHPDLKLARKVLSWLRESWLQSAVSLPDLYQRGPGAIRDKATAKRIAEILIDHGYLTPVSGPVEIDGQRRREAWGIVR